MVGVEWTKSFDHKNGTIKFRTYLTGTKDEDLIS